jgi:hypothetical protein
MRDRSRHGRRDRRQRDRHQRDDKTSLATPASIDFERLAGRAQSRGGHSFDLHADAMPRL